MTVEDLYEELKAALNYLGVGFHGMREVQIILDGGKLRMTVEGRECAIEIPEVSDSED